MIIIQKFHETIKCIYSPEIKYICLNSCIKNQNKHFLQYLNSEEKKDKVQWQVNYFIVNF